jgi:SMC interacting uncharacterized protein involved in chromosome segregation
MAEQPSLDPTSLWRDMLTQWERGLNSVANQTMGSNEFSRAMHQVTALSLRMQQTAGEAMSKSLQAMNLPTRTDILALSERIGRIEETLARLEAALPREAADTAKPAAPRPPRTRQPPTD